MLVKKFRKGVEDYNSGVFLYTCVLNKMVFSSVVRYLDGGILCEGRMGAFFKDGNPFHCLNI